MTSTFSLALLSVGLLLMPVNKVEAQPATAMQGAAIDAGTRSSFDLRLWSTDDGLLHNSVSQLVADSQGFLWFATVGGLARFDGKHFVEFRVQPEHGVKGYNIRSLAISPSGSVLILPTSGEILVLKAGLWAQHPVTGFLRDKGETPQEIFVTSSEVLWVATESGALVRWSAADGARLSALPDTPAKHIRRWSFANDSQGRVVIAADGLLVGESGSVLRPLAPVEPACIVVGQGGQGRVWIATEKGLLSLENGRLSTLSENAPWRDDPWVLRQMIEDAQGRLWFALSHGGLVRFEQGSFISDTAQVSLVACLAEDREGNLWLGTDGRGVAQLLPRAYALITTSSGLEHEVVSSVACDSQGRSFLANRQGGVAVVREGDALLRENARLGTYVYANVVCVDTQGSLWAGGGASGLHHWNPSSPGAPEKLALPEKNLHVLFSAHDGALWFAADPDILGYHLSGKSRVMTEAEGPRPHAVRCLAQDHGGQLWAGGNDGLLCSWDGARWTRHALSSALPAVPMHALLIDSDDHLWIGTAGGLFLREGERFHHFGREQGLEDDIILGLAEDRQGRLWLASRRGLFHVRIRDLLAVARGESTRVVSGILRHGDGLAGLSLTANYQPASARSSDGRLWFATSQGALVITPSLVPDRPTPPPVFIEELHFDGAVFPVSTSALCLPSGRHRLEFQLATLSFGALGRTELRHRLEGLEPEWVSTGADTHVAYTNLAPGTYRLLASARNGNGDWSPEPATLSFTIVPSWWETLTARMAGLLLLTGFIAFLVRFLALRRLRLRLRRLEQENLLERERLRIARDLHDELGAGLTEIGLLAERIAGGGAPEKAATLHDLAWRSRRLATDLSGLVWALNPGNNTLARLGQFLGQYTRRVFSGLALSCTLEGNEDLPELSLSPEVQHHFVAATKEALNNCLRHSGATEVSINLIHRRGRLCIRIRDNGRGFDPVLCGSEGNGLRNMRTRMKELGGTALVESAPGRGTEVRLEAPLSSGTAIH